MAKDNQRIALTKRLLKEGLLRLLDKKDLQKISVSELCVEATDIFSFVNRCWKISRRHRKRSRR